MHSMTRFRKMSPNAKKAVLTEAASTRVLATVEVRAGVASDELDEHLARLEATRRGWSATSRLLTIEIPAGRLQELAELREVTYLQVGGAMGPNATSP